MAALLLAAAAAAVPAAAQNAAPATPQVKSLDSEAPPGAPPHWLPNERWVMQHWIPYDEARLYRLLGTDRGGVWRWLRDDTRSLADLARARGKDPARVAARLVAPWRGKLREPHRLRVLEERALRTLTQGHLAQHILFHSLHQNAVPDNAPAIFGVASREEFQALRRAELSPVQICRLNGLPRSHAQREAVRVLKAELRAGVEGQAMPEAQAARLARRQLRQVPRWLQQTRYNGPPPLKLPRASVATASNYSNNAALAGDGASVAFEGYEAGLAGAKLRGEIGVMAASLASGEAGAGAAPASVSQPPRRRVPRSAYNPSVSADGRYVACESAEGNLNFAKRYGQMQVFVRDRRTGRTQLASKSSLDLGARGGAPLPRSAYNPSLSADGRRVAYITFRELRTLEDATKTPPPDSGDSSRMYTPMPGMPTDQDIDEAIEALLESGQGEFAATVFDWFFSPEGGGAVAPDDPRAGPNHAPVPEVLDPSEPGGPMPETIKIPEVGPNESATDYAARVEALGLDAETVYETATDPAVLEDTVTTVVPPPGERRKPDEEVRVGAKNQPTREDRDSDCDPAGGEAPDPNSVYAGPLAELDPFALMPSTYTPGSVGPVFQAPFESGLPDAGVPSGRTALRVGRFSVTPQALGRGFGWRKIKAVHGWGPAKSQKAQAALSTAPLFQLRGEDDRWIYRSGVYPSPFTSDKDCQYVVTVERRIFSGEPGPPAIETAFGTRAR